MFSVLTFCLLLSPVGPLLGSISFVACAAGLLHPRTACWGRRAERTIRPDSRTVCTSTRDVCALIIITVAALILLWVFFGF